MGKPKTDAPDPSRPLKNARWEAFAQAVFGGMTQSDAYRKSFEAKGYKAKSIHEEASRLCLKVAPRIEWLQSRAANKAIATKEELAAMLTEITRARHSDFLTMSADGVWFHDIGPETLRQAALKKVKTRVQTDKGSGDAVIEKQFDEIELESKVTAAQALSKLMGYDAPAKHDVSQTVTVLDYARRMEE